MFKEPFRTGVERLRKERELGEAIAKMYIAAQHLNMTASNAACDAMEDATVMMKVGFNTIMAMSPYNVRAGLEADVVSTRRTFTGTYVPVEERPCR